jgi:hypothetical protein
METRLSMPVSIPVADIGQDTQPRLSALLVE